MDMSRLLSVMGTAPDAAAPGPDHGAGRCPGATTEFPGG